MELVPDADPKDAEIKALRAANDGLRQTIYGMEADRAEFDAKVSGLLASKEKIISDLSAQLCDARSYIAQTTALNAAALRKRADDAKAATPA